MKLIKILRMDLKNIFSNPAWFVMNSLFPLAMSLLLAYLMKDFYGETVRSIDYFSITTLIFTAANTAVMAANTFLEDRIKRANLRIMYAPTSNVEMTLTKVLATFLYVSFYLLVLGFIWQ